MSRRQFEVDRSQAKLMGVCAGIGNHVGLDPTIVRIGFVVATIAGGWPWTLIAYFILGLIGNSRRARAAGGRRAVAGSRSETSDLDRRRAEIDSYVANSNSRLAREIEELR